MLIRSLIRCMINPLVDIMEMLTFIYAKFVPGNSCQVRQYVYSKKQVYACTSLSCQLYDWKFKNLEYNQIAVTKKCYNNVITESIFIYIETSDKLNSYLRYQTLTKFVLKVLRYKGQTHIQTDRIMKFDGPYTLDDALIFKRLLHT